MSDAFLHQVDDAGTIQRTYPLSALRETKVGRELDCQIVLGHDQFGGVSRYHVAVRPMAAPGAWELCDLGSSNGTWVNGERVVGCQQLHPGDRLVLGTMGSQAAQFLFAIAEIDAPQVPETAGVSLSQLLPILSTGKDLRQKAFLLPGVLTVVAVVLMFATIGNFLLFAALLAVYLAGAAFSVVYHLCGKSKSWWMLLLSGLFTAGILLTPVFSGFVVVFREWLPGNIENAANSFVPQLVAHFFGAGLLEELLKALPIGIMWLVGRFCSAHWRDRLGVQEPLDGILIGTASAVGFTLLETMGQYVPNLVREVLASGDEGAAYFVGLQLLIPRILGSIAGHLAYSGYFGYFIGLAVLKPKAWLLVCSIGYLTSSALHAFWNASASLNLWVSAVVGVLSYTFLAAAILKARLLSPSRSQNFATRLTPRP
jgi:RsiW-degrading membrane proteinase PrsW (M82 family)